MITKIKAIFSSLQHHKLLLPPALSSATHNNQKENGAQKLGEEADNQFSIGGSIGNQPLLQNSLPSDIHHNIFEVSTDKREEGVYNIQRENSSIKWMSSKMRLMRKMMNSDRMVESKLAEKMYKFQDHQQPSPSEKNDDNYSPTNTTRVCTDCNTTKTPLWRSGPQGPKSLCNACGIRQRKARRAIAAAAAAANGELVNSNVSMSSKIHKQKKRSKTDNISHYKKRCKFAASATRNNLCFEDFTISLSKNSAFHKVFPQDEKDAAILLMALSCGLIRS